MGFEYQAQPGSIFTPLLKSPLPADHQALRVMHAISREMKDAYPASYNDFGKLLNVISSAASGLAPMLGSFAPLASGIGVGAKLLQSVLPKSGPRDKPAQANVEAVRNKMARAAEGPVRVVVQQKQKKRKQKQPARGGLLKPGQKLTAAQKAGLKKLFG